VEGPFFQFTALLGVLGLAAAGALWLRMPVVPFYIAAGVALGGLVDGPPETVEFLGTLGVVFLLFSMGLEFSVGGLVRGARGLLGAGTMDWIFNFPVGLLVGRALGFSWVEAMFLAGIVYMSSSAVVTK
jgi:CPA2 family monovalent cation:H+ antiporter-2